MKDPILEKIKQFAIRELQARGGYVGVAENEDFASLNSDDKQGNNIIIKITSKPE